MGVSDGDPELKKAQVHTTKVTELISLLDRLQRFSDWSKMAKAVARLERCAKNMKGLIERSESTSLDERRDAEQFIIHLVQEEVFREEIKALKQGKEVKSNQSFNCTS